MRVVSGFIVREIVSQTVAVPSGDSARRLSGLVSLNDCGKFLFELLQTERTEEELVQALVAEYEVDTSTARQDVADFIQLLRDNDLLA